MMREPIERDLLEEPMPDTGTEIAVAAPEKVPALPAEAPASPVLQAIIALAKDPSVDGAKFKDLVLLQEHMEDRQAVAAFNAAFVVMQPKLPRIKKNGVLEYPVDKNKPEGAKRKVANFATWEDIDAEIRPILTEHGFALSFSRTIEGSTLTVTAVLRHSAGHSTETPGPPLPCDSSGGKNNIQGWGSALSYGKRYAATMALNIVTENQDDDGKLAGMSFLKSEQIEDLRILITETGTDERRFLDLFGVADLADLQQSHHVVARNMLLQKREMASKKKGAGA